MKRLALILALTIPTAVIAHDMDKKTRGKWALDVMENTKDTTSCYIAMTAQDGTYDDADCNAESLIKDFNSIGLQFENIRKQHPDDHYIDVIKNHFSSDGEEAADDLAYYYVMRDRLQKMLITMYLAERL